ncbi:MAG: hypothetical protein ABJA82_06350 [Myxococcales bacterium]
MPNDFTLNSIGTRGVVLYDGKADEYKYVAESTWRANGPLDAEPKAVPAAQLSALNVVVAALDNGVYVDLDRLPELDDPSDATSAQPVPWKDTPRSIFIREKNKLYQLPEAAWDDVPRGFEGDAGVLVKRGAVVAAIPSNSIPSGTYCVLVNLASLK